MSYFPPTPSSDRPVRVGLVGAGLMGRNWLQLLHESPDVELVAIIDLNLDAASKAADSVGLSHDAIATSIGAAAESATMDAVVNVTVPEAHAVLNLEALERGLPVLCEKPIVPSVREALILAAAAQSAGRLLMTSQSRRYEPTFDQYAAAVATLGPIGLVSTEFHTGPHFGGFRDRMPHPLLVDMAIHAFDGCRHLLGRDPLAVYCEEFNPAWSWYDGAAAACAIFEMEGGARFAFNGSWCNEGSPTSWNGDWTVRGARGTAKWDGLNTPTVDGTGATDASQRIDTLEHPVPAGIAGALGEFVRALRHGTVPYGDIHSNVWSLAMVQAAVESAGKRERVVMSEVMDAAYRAALASTNGALRERLAGWGTPQRGLARGLGNR